MPIDAPTFTRRALLQSMLLAACAPVAKHDADSASFESWLGAQRLRSMSHVLGNISPNAPVSKTIETKYIAADRVEIANQSAHGSNAMIAFDGDHFTQRIVAAHGAVAAAAPAPAQEPDYYFHWLRDSSLVMRAVVDDINADSPMTRDVVRKIAVDFIGFTRQIQREAQTVGFGEPRFNMDGSLDVLKWSRPQNDGPALRVLAFARLRTLELADDIRRDLDEAQTIDLDFIAENAHRTGFDLWEEYDGHDYHTRVVQLAALRCGMTLDASRAPIYARAADALARALDGHWRDDKGYLAFFDGPMTHWSGAAHEKPGANLDVGVIVGVVHADLRDGPHSPLDPRVQRTLTALEKLFAEALPINRSHTAPGDGLLYGRYAGDTYFGDNAYVMLTLEIAQFYYRCAERMSNSTSLPDREFIERATRNNAGHVTRPAQSLIAKGDAILHRVRDLSSPSGALPEQFDGTSGAPVSCRDLSWSHAAFLSATSARRSALAAVSAKN